MTVSIISPGSKTVDVHSSQQHKGGESCGVSEGVRNLTYPFPSTTSSFASCHRLLREPDGLVSVCLQAICEIELGIP